MLKVTIVCSSLIRRGPTNVIFNMLEAYYNSNIQDVKFSIVTISSESEESRMQDFVNLGIEIKSVNVKPGIVGILSLSKIKDVILSTLPDVVHSYGFRADVLLELMRLSKIPIVSPLFNNPHEDYCMQFGKLKGRLMAKFHLHILKSFNKVIVCSRFIEEKVKNDKLNLVTIYTGVPANVFVPLVKDEVVKRRLSMGIPANAKVFLFIGNLIYRKNPFFLIETFKSMEFDHENYLIIMGDGPLMSECKTLIGNSTHIRLIGAQPGTLQYLQIADYYISASYSEGFPTAVLEALSTNVLPILSDIMPHIEMIRGLSSNCIFKNNDSNSLISLINQLKSHDLTPREYLLRNYSSEIMQRNYINEYHKLIIFN